MAVPFVHQLPDSTWRQVYEAGPAELLTWAKQYTFGDNDSFNGTQQQYKPANVFQSGNDLILEARNTGGGNVGTGTYTSGMVASWNKVWFQYGYFEAKIQMPPGTGMWPAFWMLQKTVPTPQEMDIVEEFGDATTVHSGVHWPLIGGGVGSDGVSYAAGLDTSATYHYYGLEWTATYTKFYFDGILTKTVAIPSELPVDACYILLNLAVGGLGGSYASASYPVDTHITYVRVWQPAQGATFMSVSFANSDCTNCADNLGKAMVDAVTAAVPSGANITAVLTTDLGTETSRLASLGDQIVQSVLQQAWKAEQRSVAGGTNIANLPNGKMAQLLQSLNYTYLLQNGFFEAWDALDFICTQTGAAYAGLAAFLVGQGLVVDQYTADAFNQWCLSTASGAWVRVFGSVVNPTQIASAQVFPHANVDTINVFTTTGATTGTLAAGTQTLAGAKLSGGLVTPGGGTVEAYYGGTIGASSYTATVTYTNNLGVTGQTFTLAIVGTGTTGTVAVPTPNPGPNVSSIQSVAIAGANTGDIIKFRLKPVRVIAA